MTSAPATADPATKGILLAVAANRMAAMGNLDAARRAAQDGSDLVSHVLDEPEASVALLDLAKAYARLGSLWRAQAVMQRCRFSDFRMAGYTAILNSRTDAQQGHRRWW